MPSRGDPEAAATLARRNQENSEAYKNLTEDEALCLTSRVFFALGGYPDYSGVTNTDLEEEDEDGLLVPQVPSLEPEEEERLRPIYDRMFDPIKISRDKQRSLEHGSSQELDRTSSKCFEKHVKQVSFVKYY